MKQYVLLYILMLLNSVATTASDIRHLTVSEGLPNNEVRQLVELPNGQILVNCEGAFALYNGSKFVPLTCDRVLTYRLPHYTDGYTHLWQGDTLLWLRDFYRVYLLDARTRAFRYDISDRLTDKALRQFLTDKTRIDEMSIEQRAAADSAGLSASSLTTGCTDRQGGTWLGTRDNGIFYLPPARQRAEVVTGNDSLTRLVRGYQDSQGRLWVCNRQGLDCYEGNSLVMHYDQGNVSGLVHSSVQFVCELPDGRLLLCNMSNCLGYFTPERRDFHLLNTKLTVLDHNRVIVGACPLPQTNRVAIYTQSGAFVLDTQADTICPFSAAGEIERYSDKYNCMLLDRRKRLWVGTQNGLFCVQGDSCWHVTGLKNDCIRSLVEDNEGCTWVGTSCGVSRIQETSVANFGQTYGIPPVSMLERCACQTSDGRIVFAQGGRLLVFRPQWFHSQADETCPVQMVGMEIYNRNYVRLEFSALNYATPERTRYRYRLSGLDAEWLYASDGNGMACATYNALPPGHYTFEAQADIGNGTWGPLLSKPVFIQPPWWLTWWAKTAYCLTGLIVFIVLMNLYLIRRRRKLEAENDERVNHLFELREEARHQFAVNVSIDAAKISVNIEEEKLMQDLLKAVEAHIDDKDYNVDQMARDVLTNRTNLYKKMQNMLGITPTDFIRNVRLKRSAQLLATTQLTVNDISARVGFATPRNFSTQFKKMFGVMPSKYRNGTDKHSSEFQS